MFRDRTNLYLSYRQSYPHHPQSTLGSGILASDDFDVPDEHQGLMGASASAIPAGGEFGIEMDNLPPSWVDISDQVEEILVDLRGKFKQLDVFHRRNMLPGFDDRRDDEEQIELLTFDITSNLHKSQGLVKRLDQLTKNESDPAEIKMSSNMKIALATKVQDTSTQFRKMQSAYLKALRNDAFPSIDSQKSASNPYGSVQQQEEDLDIQSAESTLQQSSMLATSEDANLRQREHEITKIAQGILELADIFKDLQTMVIDQGTLLDRIDYNVETMYTNVQHADKELIKASGYQKRTQKCKIILLLVLLVVAMIIILIVKPKKHYSSTPPPSSAPPSQNPPGNVESPPERPTLPSDDTKGSSDASSLIKRLILG